MAWAGCADWRRQLNFGGSWLWRGRIVKLVDGNTSNRHRPEGSSMNWKLAGCVAIGVIAGSLPALAMLGSLDLIRSGIITAVAIVGGALLALIFRRGKAR